METELVIWLTAAATMIGNTAANEAVKLSAKELWNWTKGKLTRKSAQEKLDALQQNPSDEKAQNRLAEALQDALTDKELELNDLLERVKDFETKLKEEMPNKYKEVNINITNSKNVVGGNVKVTNGNFHLGDTKGG